MYSKLYKTIFDGSLYGQFEGLTVFMAMLALSNRHGEVDAAYAKIAGCLGCPIDFVKKGIKFLEAPDPESRTPAFEGRRIIPLVNDEGKNRPFGWQIVNYDKYRQIRNEEERRAYKKNWDRTHRKVKKSVPTKSDQARPDTTYTEAEADIKKRTSAKTPDVKSKFTFTENDLETAQWIFHRIQKINPNQKTPNFKNWANEIRKLRTCDSRTDDEIRTLFRYANEHAFWHTNILSPSKLRKQWDQLTIQQNSTRNGQGPPQTPRAPEKNYVAKLAEELGLKRDPGQSVEEFKDFVLREKDRLARERFDG